MRIDGIGLRWWQLREGGHPGPSHRIEVPAGEVREKAASDAEIDEPPVVEEPPPEEESREARGVIRLLREGHFKGVADVRLRINFIEELAGGELAEPSAPKGNGRAYEKFLEIYQGMQGTEDEVPDEAVPVDAVA